MTQPRIHKMFMCEPVEGSLGSPLGRAAEPKPVDPNVAFAKGNKTLPNGLTKPATPLAPLPGSRQAKEAEEQPDPRGMLYYSAFRLSNGMLSAHIQYGKPREQGADADISEMYFIPTATPEFEEEPYPEIELNQYIDSLVEDGISRRQILTLLEEEFGDSEEDEWTPDAYRSNLVGHFPSASPCGWYVGWKADGFFSQAEMPEGSFEECLGYPRRPDDNAHALLEQYFRGRWELSPRKLVYVADSDETSRPATFDPVDKPAEPASKFDVGDQVVGWSDVGAKTAALTVVACTGCWIRTVDAEGNKAHWHVDYLAKLRSAKASVLGDGHY